MCRHSLSSWRKRLVRESLFADVSDMPNRAGAIVGNEQAAVFGYGDAYGAAPDLAVFGDEAREEVFVATIGVTIVHGDAYNFVAGAVGSAPGAVFCSKSVPVIFLRELFFLTGIKD